MKGVGYVLIVLGLVLALNESDAWWINVIGTGGVITGLWCMSRPRGWVYTIFTHSSRGRGRE